jgi:hemerythrin-like domain-containing protein
MKATELLQKQHREIEQLLERLKRAAPEEEKGIRDELAALLVAHTVIEEESFYPAIRRAAPEIVAEAIEEHGLADYELARDLSARGGDEGGIARATVLGQVLVAHIRKEETDLFRRADATFNNQEHVDLGDEMQRRFEEVRSQGYLRFLVKALAADAPRLPGKAAPKARARAARSAPRARAAAAAPKKAKTTRRASRAGAAPAKRTPAKRATAQKPTTRRASTR